MPRFSFPPESTVPSRTLAFVFRMALSKSEIALSKREISAVSVVHCFGFDPPNLRCVRGRPRFNPARTSCQTTWETRMSWKTPKIVELPVGMEINMYACAARK
jgi:coenzyme PQQ precursor peptide PqqA